MSWWATKRGQTVAVVVVVGALLLYFAGTFDRALAPLGLNINDCIEVLGTTRCGAQVEEFRDRLKSVGDDARRDLEDKPPPPPKRASAGEPVTLATGPVRLRMTADQVQDPLPAAAGESPAAGSRYRFVGVDVRIENVGRRRYDSYLDTVALTTKGRRAKRESPIEGECGGLDNIFQDAGPRILPGDSLTECASFAVKRGDRLKELQITVPAQDATASDPEPTGVWSLRR